MKKLSLLLLVLMLTLALSACFPTAPDTTPPDNDPPATDPWASYETITIAQALELCGESGNITTERYYIRATVDTILNPAYGQMVISDETGTIEVYGTYSADGEIGYAAMTDKFYKGDEVLLHCILQNYNGTKEIKNARLIDFKKAEKSEVNEKDYKAMDIVDARAAAKGEKVKLTGVVARITFANGMKPSGFYLVDGTNSIYVYDNDAAARVAIGNTVTLLGAKTYWILDTEQTNAQTFGYVGCNQIEDVTIVSLEKTSVDFDKSWIPSSTVKDLVETPVTEDITTSIVKVSALVKKEPNTGFTNYGFYDIDGTTGSYTYTQCNGSDFAWLDEFDGKICTVYLSAINAKSTASACYFRLYPVAVIDEGYTFPIGDAPAYAIKYHAKDQFRENYTGDPALEVVTSVDSELLGFEGVEITYTSSNTGAVYFVTENGKTVMHCGDAGKATVTITATYNGNTVTDSVEITVGTNDEFNSITVDEAIAAENGTEVTVKGIIASGVANQGSGFYLIDESGSIPVRLANASMLSELALGYQVVVKGTKNVSKAGGQIVIDGAEIVANEYGKHDYSTASFIKGKTLADIMAMTDTEAATTSVYVITATIKRVTTPYSANTYIVVGGQEFMLYAGNAGHYAWLESYANNNVEYTIHLAVCDWNAKGLKGCVLAIFTESGEKISNTNNFPA